MGSEASKDIQEIADILEDDKVSMTPVTKFSCQNICSDPRSPTEGIMRTPLEVRRDVLISSGEVHLLRRWKSEPDVSLSTKKNHFKDGIHVLNDDPRSPTFGIVRTPIQVSCNDDSSCEKCLKMHGSHHILPAVISTDKNIVEDCRSPSLGIARTPIQVPIMSSERNTAMPDSILHEDNNEKIADLTPSKPWFTPLSTKFPGSGSFVYTNDENIEVKTKKNLKIFEPNSNQEKENDVNLKRKLVFTPETKTGIKVRTPLGSRCNFQDSPSQYLKIMQVQKLGQEVGICASENMPNTINVTSKNTPRKNAIVDWDKDSTLIM